MVEFRSRRIVILAAWATTLVVAASGTAYAAATITGDDIVNGTITHSDIKNGTVNSNDIQNGAVTSIDLSAQTRAGIIDEAVAQALKKAPGAPAAVNVQGLIDTTIDGLPASATPAQVAQAITNALAGYAKTTDVQTSIEAAISGQTPHATPAQVTAAIHAAIVGLPASTTPAQVATAIAAALAAQPDYTTSADVAGFVAANVNHFATTAQVATALSTYAKTSEVNSAITTAITALGAVASPADVATAISTALAPYDKTTDVDAAIAAAVSGLATTSSVDSKIAAAATAASASVDSKIAAVNASLNDHDYGVGILTLCGHVWNTIVTPDIPAAAGVPAQASVVNTMRPTTASWKCADNPATNDINESTNPYLEVRALTRSNNLTANRDLAVAFVVVQDHETGSLVYYNTGDNAHAFGDGNAAHSPLISKVFGLGSAPDLTNLGNSTQLNVEYGNGNGFLKRLPLLMNHGYTVTVTLQFQHAPVVPAAP